MHSTNLSETRVSERSVKSKRQSFLSCTLRVLACKCPRGQMNLSPPLSFFLSCSYTVTKAREEVSHQTAMSLTTGERSTIYTNKLTRRRTHTDRALADSHKYLARCNFSSPTSSKPLSLLRCQTGAHQHPSACLFNDNMLFLRSVLTLYSQTMHGANYSQVIDTRHN